MNKVTTTTTKNTYKNAQIRDWIKCPKVILLLHNLIGLYFDTNQKQMEKTDTVRYSLHKRKYFNAN